jgi:glycosyltransferase involved in cell wall biosynthesis
VQLAQPPAGAPLASWRLQTVRNGRGRQDALRPIDRQLLLRSKKDAARSDVPPLVGYLRRRWLPYSEVFVYNELRALRRYRPLVLCKETAGHPLPGVPVFPLGDVPPDRLAGSLAGVRILHGVFLTCALSFLGLARALGVPLVLSARGHDVYRRTAHELQPAFAHAARVLARTEQMAQDLIALGCPAEKIEVLPTGLLLSRFPFRAPRPPLDAAPLQVLAVGRFVGKKAIPDLLRAFAVLAQAEPRARLAVYGLGHVDEDPAEVAAAQALCAALPLHGRVQLLPAVPQEVLAQALQRSHLFLCASRTAADGDREGLPNALKEAMASGLPVVSTAHGAIAELLGGAQPCGVLAPEADPQALGEALRALAGAPERWPALAHNARARVEQRFAMERITARLEELYDRVLLGADPRA